MNVDKLRDFISQKIGSTDPTNIQYTHKIDTIRNKVYVDGHKIRHLYHQYRGKYIVLYGQPIYLDYRDTIYIIVTHTDNHSYVPNETSFVTFDDILVNTTIRIRDTAYVTSNDLTVNNGSGISLIENTVNNFLQSLSNSISNNVSQVYMDLKITDEKAYINCEPVKIQRATTHLNASEKVIAISTGNVIIDPATGEIDGNPFGEFSYPIKLVAIIPELAVFSENGNNYSDTSPLNVSGRYMILPDVPGNYKLRIRLTSSFGSPTGTPNNGIVSIYESTAVVTQLEVQIINKLSLPENSIL